MRTKLAVAALVAGLAATLAPLSPASAYCEEDPVLTTRSCTNSCMENGRRYEELRAKLGLSVLPSYWDIFLCPQG